MRTVNMPAAKSTLSRLVEAVESGQEAEIVIALNGRPAARLVGVSPQFKGRRLGIARGKFVAPEPDSEADEAVMANLFGTPDS